MNTLPDYFDLKNNAYFKKFIYHKLFKTLIFI